MYRRVLVALDGSEPSTAALREEPGETISLEDMQDAAVEAVDRELRAGEARGFTHHLADQVSIGFVDAVPYEEDDE